jgi:tRNA U34 5-methylaminomethyl-2-thiouridine-forming methyltransferase MnmC
MFTSKIMSADQSPGPKLHTTKDGSHTLYSEQYKQYYHNPNGALSESLHVFFEQNGLLKAIEEHKSLNILEMGFGTGLNFILLQHFLHTFGHDQPVHFHSIEAWPVNKETASHIDFGDFLEAHSYRSQLEHIFSTLEPGKNTFDYAQLQLTLYVQELDEVKLPEKHFDFVLYDPFSPEANPECWSVEAFSKICKSMKEDAILSTYCAASSARAAMAKSGFYLARAQGALGKREMTIASPDPGKLTHHKRLNEARLIQRLDAGEFS